MDVLVWILMAAPALSMYVIAHWHTHAQIGRRLAGDVLIAWRALGLREQVRLRRTVRRGRAVADPEAAELATHVAVVERELFDKPRAPLIGLGLGLATASLGVVVAIGGEYPPAFMLLLVAALYLWSAACTPRVVRCLSRAARENSRLAPT